MNEMLPFGAQFAEEPHVEAIQLPAYDPEAQISVGESYAPCWETDTYCAGWFCYWDPVYGNICEPARAVCDSDTECGY